MADISWSNYVFGTPAITLNFDATFTVTRNAKANTANVTFKWDATLPNGDEDAHVATINVSGDCTSISSKNIGVKDYNSGNYSYSGSDSFTVSGLNNGSGSITITLSISRWNGAGQFTGSTNTKSKSKSYTSKTVYTVTYDAAGGTTTPESQSKYYGGSLTLASAISRSSVTVTGYRVTFNSNGGGTVTPAYKDSTRTQKFTFSAWKASNGTSYNAGATYSANASTTMTAQWSTSYTNNKITLAAAPTLVGYRFTGWYDAASGGNLIGGAGADYTPSKAVTLYAHWDPEASVIDSAADTTLGNAVSVKWTPHNTAFKFKLKFESSGWAGYTTDFITVSSLSAYTYTGLTLPIADFAPLIPNSTSGTVTVTLTTYKSDGTQLGNASSKTFSYLLPSSVVPIIDSTVLSGKDDHFLPGGEYVIGRSTLGVEITAHSQYGASMVSARLTYDGVVGNIVEFSEGVASMVTGKLSGIGAKTWAVVITDSRGRTAQTTGNIQVFQLAKPAAEDIDLQINGDTIVSTIKGSIDAVNGKNVLSVSLSKKKISTGSATSVLSKTEVVFSDTAPATSKLWGDTSSGTIKHYSSGSWVEYEGSYFTITGGYSGRIEITLPISHTDADLLIDSFEYSYTIYDLVSSNSSAKITGVLCMDFLAGGRGAAFFGTARKEGLHVYAATADADAPVDEDYTILASDWSDLEDWFDAN